MQQNQQKHRVRLFVRLMVVVAAAWLVGACGGGGGGCGDSSLDDNLGGGGGVGLSGTLNVTSFVIPAGESRTVTGNLVVNSVQDLRIEGELLITPGTRVALFSEGTVGIHGPIRAAPGRKGISRQEEEPLPPALVIAGKNVEITRRNTPFVLETADFGDGVFITTLDPNGTVTISQDIVTKPGRDATSLDAEGGLGGGIEVGSSIAIDAATDYGKSGASKPKSVTITSTLTTGRGGHGFSDLTGREVNGNLEVGSTDGGFGGSVFIDSARIASDPQIPRERVILGRGGNSGSCGAPGNPVRGQSGQQPGAAGQSVVASLAVEGQGGQMFLAEEPTGHRGESGIAGSVHVAAGNGGPGGNGGNTMVRLIVGFPPGGASQVVLEDGGNGGPATQQFVNGGRGGDVDIFVRGLVAGMQPPAPLHGVTIRNYGNGGAGFGGCSATPNVPGTNGGAGGSLAVPPPLTHDVADSFRGGRAGDGNPPGVKGAGGTFTRDGARYPDGAAGAVCGSGGPNEIVFDQQEVSLLTNEEKLVTLTRRGPLAQVSRVIQVTIRSEDGTVVLIRNLTDNQVGKSFTVPWPVGQPTITFKAVGGVQFHNEPDIIATIVDSEFGGISSTLEILNVQELTTRVELTAQNGSVIPAGTVLALIPDGGGRVRGMGIAAPGGGCSQWHGVHGPSGSATIDGSIVGQPEGPCGYGAVIQPQHSTDRSRAERRSK